MRTRYASFRENVLSLCRYCLVIPTLVALGCASLPNLIPKTLYEEEMLSDGTRRIVARAGYAINHTAHENSKNYNKVPIRWTYRGEWVWGPFPFTTARLTRFILRQPGGNEILCDSGEILNTGKEYEDYLCEIDVKKNINKYIIGEVNVWWKGNPGDILPLPDEVVHRTYILTNQPNPIE